MIKIAASKLSLTLAPYSCVLTTITDPLLTLSDGKPFLKRATSLYTLPVLTPANMKGLGLSSHFPDFDKHQTNG